MHCRVWCLGQVSPAPLTMQLPMYLLSCRPVPNSTHFIRRRMARDCPQRLSLAIQDFTSALDWPSQTIMAIPGSKEGKLSSAQNQRNGRLILNKVDAESVGVEVWPTRAG